MPVIKSNQIKFKTSMIRSNLCHYSNAYIYLKKTITVPNTRTAAAPNDGNTKVAFKKYFPFNNCISEIKNT